VFVRVCVCVCVCVDVCMYVCAREKEVTRERLLARETAHVRGKARVRTKENKIGRKSAGRGESHSARAREKRGGARESTCVRALDRELWPQHV